MLPLDDLHHAEGDLDCAILCSLSQNDCQNFMFDQATGTCSLDSVNELVPQPSAAESTLFSLGKFCQVNETVNFIGNGRMGSCLNMKLLVDCVDKLFYISTTEQQNIARKNSNVLYDPTIYKSCSDVKNSSNPRQLLQLSSGLVVMCDTVTDGGGWTIFQRRVSGVVDFYRNWEEYKHGFGDFDAGEFYLGNENIYCLIANKSYVLRIDMKYKGQGYYALYSGFKFYSEVDFYKLSVQGFTGNTSDSLSLLNNNQKFSTFDRDNDADAARNCAVNFHGAWWYAGCHYTNLNGIYGSTEFGKGMEWLAITGDYGSLDQTEMKIRPL
ncbi:techylectin-like protein [Physella acuta]|uniref:techylectin-like protein n=1 Tax=Physella acuta TaxID=109671 RepID=UPI0027DC7B1F|nr:techylectin-like protein [Physella acuta]